MPGFQAVVLLAAVLAGPCACAAAPRVVAAESVYGQVAAQIAGDAAAVTSVLSNPGQDPHEFEAAASTARAVADASVVIVNGAGYDPWMDRLLAASPAPGRQVISAALLAGVAPGGDPHLWYDPAVMPRVAQAVAAALARGHEARAPGVPARGHEAGAPGVPARGHEAGAPGVPARLAAFLAGAEALQARIAALRARLAAAPVEATEPVFDYMAAALGLTMRNARFQLAVMNGTEPRAADVAAMETDLRTHRVRALIYNAQVSDPASMRLRIIARSAGVPVVGVSETLPAGSTYLAWMRAEVDAVAAALGAP